MATYKEIKGVTIQTLDSDPTVNAGSWASGGALNTARFANAGVGTQTAAISIAGSTGPPNNSNNVAIVEQYNGSSWTEVADLPASIWNASAAGTSTAVINFGGAHPPGSAVQTLNTYYNGSSWTELADLNTGRYVGAGAGTAYTAALSIGGAPSAKAIVEQWDGSSWTEVGDLNAGRSGISSNIGTSTASLAVAGATAPGPYVTSTEQWNGSAWTEVSDLNQSRSQAGGSGLYTDAVVFGGDTPPGKITNTESWDGSSWTEVNDLSTARRDGANAGTSSRLALYGGGDSTSATAVTEEWSFPSGPHLSEGQIFLSGGTTLKGFGKAAGIPSSAWASGGALNSPRGNAGTSGTQTAALFFGGDGPPGTIAITELYNGSSWTEVGDLNVARSQTFFSNQGTSTAALNAAGTPAATSVESWDGSSWTETTDLNTARRNGSSLGTQTAMLGTGGYREAPTSAYATLTEIWDGTSWTETGDCPDAKFIGQGGGGTTTAGIIAGNYPNGDVDSSQTWDGTSWTNGPNINTGRSGIAFSATSQSSALAHGGGVGSPQAASALCEFYNGTAWTELNDMAQASQSGGGAGSSILGIHYGGYAPGALTTTEEWTADAALSTVTVS